MSTTPTSPAAGWYPSPDGSSAMWWWDGAKWLPPGQQVSFQPAAPTGVAKLAIATQVLLIVCAVLSIITIGLEVFGISAVTGFLDGQDSAAIQLLDAYDMGTLVISITSSVALLATGVVWVIWQYHAAKQVPGQTRRSPGWHAGSWFIPVVNWWFPYQNISDLWRAVGRSRPSWQPVWWLLWVVSNVVVQVATRVYLSSETLEQFRIAMWASVAGEALLVAAAAFAVLVVRGITHGILERGAAIATRYV